MNDLENVCSRGEWELNQKISVIEFCDATYIEYKGARG